MQILILAGKNVDEETLLKLLGDTEHGMARYSKVSQGVRLLEKKEPDLVLLAPDENDTTWSRAARRIRSEFRTPVLLAYPKGAGAEDKAFECGVFDCFELGVSCSGEFVRVLRHLENQLGLEKLLAKKSEMFDWVEEVGHLGSWEMEDNGKIRWSNGLRQVFRSPGASLDDSFSSIRQFVHPDDLDVYDQANKATFEDGWPLDFGYRIICEENEVKHLHVHRRVELNPAGEVVRVYGMAKDISSQKRFENFLYRRDAILQVVGAFAGRSLRESDWEDSVENVLSELGKATDATRAFVFNKSLGQDGVDVLSMKYEWASPRAAPVIDRPDMQNQPIMPSYGRWKAALQRRKVVVGHVGNFQLDEQALFLGTDTKSVLIVPVFVGTDWWGFMGLSEQREERDWLPVEIESLSLVASIFGSAILRRQMESQLVEANRSAEEAKTVALEASKAKSRFLANMSHEIRTPISGIMGVADMAITTGLNAEQREYMDMIRDAAGSLLAVVNDVLDISKIEADKMELKPVNFEFRNELDTAVRSFGLQAEQKGLNFIYTVKDDVPSSVNGDPERLWQVLRNLIGNSLKFSEHGFIELTVEVLKRSADRICLLFSVRDTGEGIAEDKLHTIFDSFTQADSSVRKKHQGTGLGLSISKELVEMMGGEIGVKSEPDRGSTFSFTAWFGRVKDNEEEAETSPVISSRPLHLNILLAEDNPLNQKFLTHFLTMFGHNVTLAENGIQALDILNEAGRDMDVVLMDIQMPEMGGFEATQAIRQSDGSRFDPGIPVIALTAYAMQGDKERMVAAGMDDYVSKPVDMNALSKAIDRSVTARGGERVVRDAPVLTGEDVKAAGDVVSVELDMEGLVERFDGNMILLKDILDLFMLEAAEKLDKLDEGVRGKNAVELGMALHSITNIASHVLAMDVVLRSRELEKRCYLGDMGFVLAGVAKLRQRFVALVQTVGEYARTL